MADTYSLTIYQVQEKDRGQCWPSLSRWGNLTKAFIPLIDLVHSELHLARKIVSPALMRSWKPGLAPKIPQQICYPAPVAGSQASGPPASVVQL